MLKTIIIIAFLAFLLLSTYIISYKKNKLSIAIFPQKARMDQAIKIVLSNLLPDELVTIETVQSDSANHIWRSKVIFQADKNGMINLEKMSPVSGSYRGVDGMGIFRSMLPDDKKIRELSQDGKNFTIVMSFYRNNEFVAQKVIERIVSI